MGATDPCASPSVSASTPAIPFGKVKVGFSSLGQPVTITNKGKCAVNVMINFPSVFKVSKGSFSLEPGKSETITVTFRPSRVKHESGHLKITPGSSSVFLTGEGTPK
jgi:hypothetical protein